LSFAPRNVHEWVNEPYILGGVFALEYQVLAIAYQGVCGTMVKRFTEPLILRRFSHLKRRVLPLNQ